MEVKTKHALVVVALALSTCALALAAPAGASHVRPKGATPLRDSLVIAQKQCASFNNTHNSPPTVQSCTQPSPFPQQESSWLTAGTADVNGAGSNSVGFVRLDVLSADIQIQMSLSDVRCMPATALAVCPTPNAAAGRDYTGELQLQVGLQITDHSNVPSSFTNTGTLVAIPFPVKVPCTSTGSTTIGSACGILTTMNSVAPNWAQPNKRMSFEIPQGVPGGGIQVFDGGMNGIAGSTGSTLFAETGVFVP